ncbi:hypothetical protein Scep_017763 [Stephania cephalantha]|uniref:Bidirectional sugar transporter SWEET n=1 Tax=Stephania cephalantha TaxID=152367 RepID=A0AAP0IR23_9MAGN
MMNHDAIRNVIGIIGNVVSFCLFASPLPTFLTIVKKAAVEDFSPNPYLAALINCLMWVFYGLPFVHPHSILVVTINGIGGIMELGYIVIYIIYANRKQRWYVIKVLVIEVVFTCLVVGLTLGLCHTYKTRSLVAGIIALIFNICMYGMPLDIVRLVIRTRSVEYMPFYLSLANFLNGCIWVAFALLRFDLFIMVSNGTGAILGAVQLAVYATYSKNPERDNKRRGWPEVQLQTTNTRAGI